MRPMATTSVRLSLAATLLCFSMAGARADQLETIQRTGRLRIAIINGLSGYSFTQPGQGFIGSDVETARLLARDLGVKPEFVYVTNAERIPALKAGRADLVVSALSITPERERDIVLSVPYATIGVIIGAPQAYDIGSYRDLRGKTVGTGSNTADSAMLRKKAPAARIIEFDNEPALIEGYLHHRFDIISCQEGTLRELNSLLPHDRQMEIKFIQTEFQIAIGMPRNEPSLRQWVDRWIVQNLIDGRLNEIFRRYHGRPLPESILPVVSRRH